mgnify:CR=1 FL=1
MSQIWKEAIVASFDRFLGKVLSFLPNLLAMATIVIVGFLTAWIVKLLLVRFLRVLQFDRVSEQWGLSRALSKGGVRSSPGDLLARFFYWLIVLITLILGINALEVTATQSLISHFFNFLPHLFTALGILVIGYLLGIFLGQATLIAAVNAHIESAKLLSLVVRWFIIILSLTMALYHLGIAEKVIVAAFSITFGGIVLALAIAFGWGGHDLARDFLERVAKRRTTRKEETNGISHL